VREPLQISECIKSRYRTGFCTIEIDQVKLLKALCSKGSKCTFTFLARWANLAYMEKDWALARFFALVGFFEGAMSAVAISNSLLVSYDLLELLTLSTYALVGFWYAQSLVVKAARDAF
jgi:formate hydrogenlyase subunit 3/multisubunit Na+/H+ antiporter MnhD subunit